jgi:hypothetical protein
MICHPTANFLGHYALPGLAARGVAAIGLTTRYVGNDTSLIMENCLLDIGSMVAHLTLDRLREDRPHRELGWGVDRSVLGGRVDVEN